MCWATCPGKPVGIEIPGNQNADPFASLELELPTNAGMPKETDGVAVAMPRHSRSGNIHRNPVAQRSIVRILLIVPLYSMSSFVALEAENVTLLV